MAKQKDPRGVTLAMTALAGLFAGLPACSPSPATTEVVVPTSEDKQGTSDSSAAAPDPEPPAEDPEPPTAQVASEEPQPATATVTAESATAKQETVARIVKPKVKKPKAAAQAASPKSCCAGKNDCKGLGGCKTNDNACMGKNMCKGKGGCSMGRCSNP